MKKLKAELKNFNLDYCIKSIKTVASQKENLLNIFRKGREKGTKTYIRDLDDNDINGNSTRVWSWKLGEMNLWTGYMNEGKSQFLIYACLLKAIREGWKFAFFSPENDPPTEFFDDLVHTILGKTTDRNNPNFNVTENEYISALSLIENNFFFVYPEDLQGYPDYTIKNIESIFEYLIFEKDVKAVIIDPYIKIKHEMEIGEQEHLYASRFMMERVHFARKHNVSYHLVMHQTTPRKDKETGNYPQPDPYYIKGGGTFADSTDNVLTVWRPNKVTDPMDDTVIITSAKIKKHKLVGYPASVKMGFSRKKNRYISKDGYDYFDGSNNEAFNIYQPDKFHKIDVNFDNIKAPF